MPRVLRIALLLLAVAGTARAGDPPPDAERDERYPATFRQNVKLSLERAVERLRKMQSEGGHFGNPQDLYGLGHSALPTLALLKAGVPPDDVQIRHALRVMAEMPREKVYSVGVWMMLLGALYAPHVDALDEEVGSERELRLRPKDIRQLMSKEHAQAMEEGVEFLVRAQCARGLWDYGIQEGVNAQAFDLSNSQYALLGLRAAVDSGIAVPHAVWKAALRELVEIQEQDGPAVEMLQREVREGYVIQSRTKAKARGWRYSDRRKNSPLGENTLWEHETTASMTTAGLAMVAICTEGLWRSRRFSGKDRRDAAAATRDALAWMQENFSVTENLPLGAAHYHYYLYGLERAGMLTGQRWIGPHDWYFEGATQWLAKQRPDGAWGDHVATSFGILFLKRATRRAETVVLTGE